MKKVIITLSREYGSGGLAIGQQLAEALGIPFYDKKLLSRAAEESGFSEEMLRQAESKATNSLLYSLATSLGVGAYGPDTLSLYDKLYLAQFDMIRKVADEGIAVVIANGKRDNILTDIVNAESAKLLSQAPAAPAPPYTRFAPAHTPTSGVKKWIAHSEGFAKGALHINRQMAEVLTSNQAASILPVGITRVEGEFEKDDLVRIIDPDGQQVGVGKANCSAGQAREDVGRHGKKPVVHYDYLYIE